MDDADAPRWSNTFNSALRSASGRHPWPDMWAAIGMAATCGYVFITWENRVLRVKCVVDAGYVVRDGKIVPEGP